MTRDNLPVEVHTLIVVRFGEKVDMTSEERAAVEAEAQPTPRPQRMPTGLQLSPCPTLRGRCGATTTPYPSQPMPGSANPQRATEAAAFVDAVRFCMSLRTHRIRRVKTD